MHNRVDPARVRRALTERIHLLKVDETSVCHVVGSKGDRVYEVSLLGGDVDCSCPDCERGNICKHILFVWIRVLRLEAEDVVFDIDDELRAEIIQKLADVPQHCYFPQLSGTAQNNTQSKPQVKRQPFDKDTECPICFEILDPAEPNKIIWCQYSCGNNVHRDCFQKWCQFTGDSCVTCRQKFF